MNALATVQSDAAAAQANDVAAFVLSISTWAVLGLTCCIELYTQQHYVESIESETEISPLWKDVFMYHWREECQHAILDEIESLTPIVQG